VSPEKNVFHCFGCGAGGDSVRFVAELLRLTPLEAARTIAADFGLVVGNDQPLTREARRKLAEARRRAELERELEARFEAAANEAHQAICLLLRCATDTLIKAILRRSEDTLKRLAFWLHWLPWLEYLADQLYSPDPAERLAALQEMAKWVS
jgi:DNA primase